MNFGFGHVSILLFFKSFDLLFRFRCVHFDFDFVSFIPLPSLPVCVSTLSPSSHYTNFHYVRYLFSTSSVSNFVPFFRSVNPAFNFYPSIHAPSPPPLTPEHGSSNSQDNNIINDDNNSSALQFPRVCVRRGGWERVICGRSFAAVKFTYRFHVHCRDGRAGSFFSLKTR